MASRELGQRHAGDRELVRRNDPLTYMQSQINRIFDDFWGSSRWPETAAFSPQLDVKETDKEIQVCAELPGIRDQGFGRRSE